MFNFRKPTNELEVLLQDGGKTVPSISSEMFSQCPGCKKSIINDYLQDNNMVCPECGHHFKMKARARINLLCDSGSFTELDADTEPKNILDFPEYSDKLENAAKNSLEKEAVITGYATIGSIKCCIFVMEGNFMMGSMGAVVGEKITRLFEYATLHRLPVIGYTMSGGARMQEGIISLMQMAKTSGAVKMHSDAGLLYVAVLTDPTTGGVTASFAMEADIITAEPNALICFAGPRVIEQTTKQKLPKGFQRAEFLLEKGFLDTIVPRGAQRQFLSGLLAFHKGGEA